MRKLLSLALVLCMVLAGLCFPANASNEPGFTDLPDEPWYNSYLWRATDLGFFSGTSSTTFSPDRPLTRAQAVTVLSKVHQKLTGEKISAGKTAGYTDVSPDSWYSKAVDWATENGIVCGKGKNCFAPNKVVTHGELAVIFHQYLKLVGKAELYEPVSGAYEDEDQLPGWIKEHVRAVSGYKLFNLQFPNLKLEFAPQAATMRDEAAALFVRLYEKAAYPVDNETPRQGLEYFFRTIVDGARNPFLPLGEEHAKIITSYKEYTQVLAALDNSNALPQPAELTVAEELFAEHNLVAVEVQHEGEPAFRCDLGNLTVEGDTASVTLVESKRGGTTASTKGVMFFAAVPKNVDSVKLSCLEWTERNVGMPS